MEHVEVNASRIAYTRAGAGPPLVLLHGAPCDSRTWQWMVPDLSRDHTVVAWDAPGFGESSDIDDTWRAPEFADVLAAFITALDLERYRMLRRAGLSLFPLSLASWISNESSCIEAIERHAPGQRTEYN